MSLGAQPSPGEQAEAARAMSSGAGTARSLTTSEAGLPLSRYTGVTLNSTFFRLL